MLSPAEPPIGLLCQRRIAPSTKHFPDAALPESATISFLSFDQGADSRQYVANVWSISRAQASMPPLRLQTFANP